MDYQSIIYQQININVSSGNIINLQRTNSKRRYSYEFLSVLKTDKKEVCLVLGAGRAPIKCLLSGCQGLTLCASAIAVFVCAPIQAKGAGAGFCYVSIWRFLWASGSVTTNAACVYVRIRDAVGCRLEGFHNPGPTDKPKPRRHPLECLDCRNCCVNLISCTFCAPMWMWVRLCECPKLFAVRC